MLLKTILQQIATMKVTFKGGCHLTSFLTFLPWLSAAPTARFYKSKRKPILRRPISRKKAGSHEPADLRSMLFAILVSNYGCISNAYWFPLEITAIFYCPP